MNSQNNSPQPPQDEQSIAEANIQRLLGRAYDPEAVDPAFAERVHKRMLAAAWQRSHPGQPARLVVLPRRRLLAISAAAAAVIVGMGIWAIVAVQRGWHPPQGPGGGMVQDVHRLGGPAGMAETRDSARAVGLTARPRPPAPPAKAVAVGTHLETAAGQRRRAELPDGSAVFLNAGTKLQVAGQRRLRLERGEIFVEVARAGAGSGRAERFVVATPHRQVTATGTKFAVRADSAGTSVLVAQGEVAVSGFAGLVHAGRQLSCGADGSAGRLSAIPRASHVLAWTKELIAAAQSPLVPKSDYAGGALIALDPDGQEARLSLRKYHVDVHIEDGFARTTIDQTYFNHTQGRLEGTFYFPLPPDASISRLAMYVDGKLMEGGMAERSHARYVFEDIMHTRRDPALLEWVDGCTFKMRVFPLEPRQEKRIILSYTQRLSTLYGQTEYRFPGGHSMELVDKWSFHARVVGGAELKWSCPGCELSAAKQGRDLLLDASKAKLMPDADVVVYLEEADPAVLAREFERFSTTVHEGQRYLMLRFRPDLRAAEAAASAGAPVPARLRAGRDWVFLFETSGDRDPLEARVQIEVIRCMLDNAAADDRFAVLAAGTHVRALAESLQPVTAENVAAALADLENAHLVGALDLEGALAAARPILAGCENAYLVHTGSGIAVLGERQTDKLVALIPPGAHYVGVGVGKRWAREFMAEAAARTGGFFTQINPDENVAWRAFELSSTLEAPRLLEVKVSAEPPGAAFLCFASSLADGEELCAVARFGQDEPPPAALTITGSLDGRPYSRTVPLANVAEGADYLPRFWAKLEIDRLLAEGAEKNREKVVALSKAMYVMSPFTSLLVLENEQMYQQYNVGRGRKDHWALYPAPEKIAVVHEPIQPLPLGKEPTTRPKDPAKKPSVEEVLKSIVIRIPPRLLRWPGEPYSYGASWITADRLGRGAYAVPYTLGPDFDFDNQRLGEIASFVHTAGEGLSGLEPAVAFVRFPDPPYLTYQYYLGNVSPLMLRVFNGKRMITYLSKDGQASELPTPSASLTPFVSDGGWSRLGSRAERRALDQWASQGGRLFASPPVMAATRIYDIRDLSLQMPNFAGPSIDLLDMGVNNAGGGLFGDTGGRTTGGGLFGNTAGDTGSGLFGGDSDGAILLPRAFSHSLRLSLADLRHLSPGELDDMRESIEEVLAKFSPEYRLGQLAGMSAANIPWYEVLRYPVDWPRFPGTVGDTLTAEPPESEEDRAAERKLGEILPKLEFAGAPFEQVIQSMREITGLDIHVNWSALEQGYVKRDAPITLKLTDVTIRAALWRIVNEAAEILPLYYAIAEGAITISTVDDLVNQATARRMIKWTYYPLISGQGRLNVLYERPSFSGDWQVFSDLLAFAPGMNTSPADVLATLESEADLPQLPPAGKVDPQARELIESARKAGWQALTLERRSGAAEVTVFFDGAGRYAWQRTTPEGLTERVLCDGRTLWHLYDELGVGSRRAVSRFHQAAFRELVPWLLPPADELARGADLLHLGGRKVAICPAGAAEARDKDGKPLAYLRAELAFAEDGRLVERRIVEMPAGKVLATLSFAEPGKLRWLDGEGKLLAEREIAHRLAPAQAPDLQADTKRLVILPMPLRTVEHLPGDVRQALESRKLDSVEGDAALALIASCYGQARSDASEVIRRRFLNHGDRRIGFYSIMLSVFPAEPNPDSDNIRSPLADYISQQANFIRTGQRDQFPTFGWTDDGFIHRLADFRRLYAYWNSDKARSATEAQRRADRRQALDFARRCRSSLLGWAMLTVAADRAAGDQGFHRDLGMTALLFKDVEGLDYFARYEAARWLAAGGEAKQAVELFSALYDETLARGFLPPIEGEFRDAFNRSPNDPAQFTQLMRRAAAELIEKKAWMGLVALAGQLHALGEAALAEEALTPALAAAKGPWRLPVRLAAVELLAQAGQYARADALLEPLLEDEALAGDPLLWRLGALLAERGGRLASAAARLERAMAIEYADLPEVLDLRAIRADHQELLGAYRNLAQALAMLEAQPPGDMLGRIVRAADRWRSLDPDATTACQLAAAALQDLGATELSWEYLTTPLAMRPNEAAPWTALAESLKQQGQLELADRAYASAFQAEQTNAQILWDRSQLLQQLGRSGEADKLLRQIARGTWPRQFNWIQEQARRLVGG